MYKVTTYYTTTVTKIETYALHETALYSVERKPDAIRIDRLTLNNDVMYEVWASPHNTVYTIKLVP